MNGIPLPMAADTRSEIIQAVSTWSGMPDRFFDLGPLTWAQKHDVREELKAQGFFVKNVFLEDTMATLVAAEIRKRAEKEVESPS